MDEFSWDKIVQQVFFSSEYFNFFAASSLSMVSSSRLVRQVDENVDESESLT